MKTLHELNKDTMLKRLAVFGYRVLPTAKSLGLCHRTLYNKLYSFGLNAQMIHNARREYLVIEAKEQEWNQKNTR